MAGGCGVYVGIASTDYIMEYVQPCGTEFNAFALPGNVLSVAAGRLSFVFGLKAGGLLRTTSRPTLDRRYTEIWAWVTAHRSVGHHDPCLRNATV